MSQSVQVALAHLFAVRNCVLKRSITGGTTTLAVYPSSAEEYAYTSTGTLTSQLHYYTLAGHLIGAFDGTTTTFYLTDALGSVLTSFSQSAILGEQVCGRCNYGGGEKSPKIPLVEHPSLWYNNLWARTTMSPRLSF